MTKTFTLKKVLRIFIFSILIHLFHINAAQAQLSFFTRNVYFPNESIKKVRVSNDGDVYIIKTNNEVALIKKDGSIVDLTSLCKSISSATIYNDIVGYENGVAFIATQGDYMLKYNNGVVTKLNATNGIVSPNINSLGIENSIYSNSLRLMVGTDLGGCYSDNAFTSFTPAWGAAEKVECVLRSVTFKNTHLDFNLEGYGCGTKRSFYTISNTGSGTLYSSGYLNKSQNFNEINTALSVSRYRDGWMGPKVYWGTNNGLRIRNWSCRPWDFGPKDSCLLGIKVNKIVELNSFAQYYSPNNFNSSATAVLAGTDKGLYFSNNLQKYSADTFRVAKNYENLMVNHIEIQSIISADKRSLICDEFVWLATDKGLYQSSYKWDKEEYPILKNFIYTNQPANKDTIRTCEGTKVTFTAVVGAGGTTQWQKDGIDIPNANSGTYTTDQPGKYRVILGTQCDGTLDVTKEIVFIQEPKPLITFNYPDTIKSCVGTSIKLETLYNTNYTYAWFKDNALLYLTSSSVTLNTPGKYKVRVSNCTGGFVESKEVYLDFQSVKKPILNKDKVTYCEKDIARLSATISLGNKIKWYQNGQLINNNGNELLTNVPGSYFIEEENSTGCSNRSDIVSLNFESYPTLKITPSKIAVCFGETVELTAETNASTVVWSTGETTKNIKINKAGKYFAIAFTNQACQVKDTAEIIIRDKIVLTLDQDTSLCERDLIPIVLSAPKGFKNYYWNDKPAYDTLTVYKAGFYTLKVEDQNGCSGYASVLVRNANCKELPPLPPPLNVELTIPNVISPNGDGINDVWLIPDVEKLEELKISVFDRYGSKVFQSKGGYIPWKGCIGNKELPSGTYYYTIISKNLKKTIAGSLTIVR